MSPLFHPALGCVLALALAAPFAAAAQTTGSPPPDGSAPTSTGPQVDSPTSAQPPASTPAADTNALSSICTDRPTKSNFACTVDAGHFQYESDIANISLLKLNGVTTDTLLIFNPTLKYGLTSNLDLEANFSPVEIVRTHDDATGLARTLESQSDLYLRLKYQYLDLDKGNLQAAVIPYIKAPTARPGIGNGSVEGGLIFPVNYKLNSVLTLTTVPEVDFYRDSNGGGRHVNTIQLINIGWSLPRNFTLYGELWGDWNFDPAGTVKQCSFDTALAYGVTNYLQLDVGINFGLNRETPGVQPYVGISQKF